MCVGYVYFFYCEDYYDLLFMLRAIGREKERERELAESMSVCWFILQMPMLARIVGRSWKCYPGLFCQHW